MSRSTPLRLARLLLAVPPLIDAAIVAAGTLLRLEARYRARVLIYGWRLRRRLERSGLPEWMVGELMLIYLHTLRRLRPLVVLGVAAGRGGVEGRPDSAPA